MTQHEKIITLMARYDRWFLISDFQKPNLGGLFVGYKASARINELEKDYPDMFLTRPNGRFVERKLNKDNINDWFYDLSPNLKRIIRQEGLEPNLTPEQDLARRGYKLA